MIDPSVVSTSFTRIRCYKCAVEFWIPDGLRNARQKDHECFWCPNGHSQVFTGENETARLKRQLEDERRWKEQALSRANVAERSLVVQKRKTTTYKNKLHKVETRIQAGVCPCCNRTFQNLARHMKTKHS